jgi:hypothetical protein
LIGRDPDKEWEKFGRNDPYYGVMSLEKFHKAASINKGIISVRALRGE